MSGIGPEPARSTDPVVQTLYEISQGFDGPVGEPDLRRALRLLCRIVPNHRCAVLDVSRPGAARLVVEPDAPEEHAPLRRVLTRFLTMLSDDMKGGSHWELPDIAALALWASPSHLAVPLIGLDEVLGVLFARHRAANGYTNGHLQLLSIVAGQIAAPLAVSRLREQHAESLQALGLSRGAPRRSGQE